MATKRILIIDDDVELCEEIVEALKEEGCLVDCVYDVVEGEKRIRVNNYNIILLDYKMSGETSADVLKKLKADNIRKRIFIFSGRPSVEKALKQEGVFDMVSGIIAKPINFESFLKKIKQL